MGYRQKFDEDYEFDVRKGEEYSDKNIGYSVSLPHQCGNWNVLAAEDTNSDIKNTGDYPGLPLSKDFAVKQMELFCKRALEALEKLKKLK